MGKEEIENFFHRERPKNVPIARQISAMRFQHVDVKRERGQQRPPQSSHFRRHHKMVDAREVQSTQNGQQQKAAAARCGQNAADRNRAG